ncbi:MAG: GTP cyclohydrolase II [Endozoicomonadaceae bacterium]|nr:GTP cyclohydrolase II [Endozoicomonadaceae bacterium]
MLNTFKKNTRANHKTNIQYSTSTKLPTTFGEFTLHVFENIDKNVQYIALSLGRFDTQKPPLVRVHSECFTGDTLFSLRCDCGAQLKQAMVRIAKEKAGLILYLPQEGRGIGLLNKIRAYHMQDLGADTVEANELLGFKPDCRSYEMCAMLFKHFGIQSIRLMTNNPAKLEALSQQIDIIERVSLTTIHNHYNQHYLNTKIKKLGHLIS